MSETTSDVIACHYVGYIPKKWNGNIAQERRENRKWCFLTSSSHHSKQQKTGPLIFPKEELSCRQEQRGERNPSTSSPSVLVRYVWCSHPQVCYYVCIASLEVKTLNKQYFEWRTGCSFRLLSRFVSFVNPPSRGSLIVKKNERYTATYASVVTQKLQWSSLLLQQCNLEAFIAMQKQHRERCARGIRRTDEEPGWT